MEWWGPDDLYFNILAINTKGIRNKTFSLFSWSICWVCDWVTRGHQYTRRHFPLLSSLALARIGQQIINVINHLSVQGGSARVVNTKWMSNCHWQGTDRLQLSHVLSSVTDSSSHMYSAPWQTTARTCTQLSDRLQLSDKWLFLYYGREIGGVRAGRLIVTILYYLC